MLVPLAPKPFGKPSCVLDDLAEVPIDARVVLRDQRIVGLAFPRRWFDVLKFTNLRLVESRIDRAGFAMQRRRRLLGLGRRWPAELAPGRVEIVPGAPIPIDDVPGAQVGQDQLASSVRLVGCGLPNQPRAHVAPVLGRRRDQLLVAGRDMPQEEPLR